jgi:murein DD-endopeptidase MepM/ murein hydrolase activator NlpD
LALEGAFSARHPVDPGPRAPDYEIKMMATAEKGDKLQALLLRAGVAAGDAREAHRLVKATAALSEGNDVTILLGDRVAGDGRSLRGLSYRPQMDLLVQLIRDEGDKLRLATQAIAVDATPRRFRGRAGDNLYWSMRAAGVAPEMARQYLDAVSDRLGSGWRARPDDRFDMIVDHRLAATGETRAGPILYAALDRKSGSAIRLVRWTVAGHEDLYEPGKARQRADGLHGPVAGTVSSPFGVRIHPILRFARFHRGVDYRAAWGSPVYAAADGAVIMTGWNGGYGRQVRLAHMGGLETSYSHLSGIAASPGDRVRKGQVIGYVGSSGFSTGPHLHFEVSRYGRLLDPLTVRRAGMVSIPAADLAAMNARLAQLQSI